MSTTVLTKILIAAEKTIVVLSSLPPSTATAALPQPPHAVVAFVPPPTTTDVAPSPPEAIIHPDVEYRCCRSSYQGRGENGGGANHNYFRLIYGQTQPPLAPAVAAPIVSEEDWDIGTSFPSLTPIS